MRYSQLAPSGAFLESIPRAGLAPGRSGSVVTETADSPTERHASNRFEGWVRRSAGRATRHCNSAPGPRPQGSAAASPGRRDGQDRLVGSCPARSGHPCPDLPAPTRATWKSTTDHGRLPWMRPGRRKCERMNERSQPAPGVFLLPWRCSWPPLASTPSWSWGTRASPTGNPSRGAPTAQEPRLATAVPGPRPLPVLASGSGRTVPGPVRFSFGPGPPDRSCSWLRVGPGLLLRQASRGTSAPACGAWWQMHRTATGESPIASCWERVRVALLARPRQ